MKLKARLANGVTTVGSWMSLGSAAIAEIMADSGFDWLVIDLEHTATTLREAEEIIRVVELKGVPALVRVSANDPVQIKRVLDSGASGVVVPSVSSAQQARDAVSAVFYPPRGARGVGLGRAQGYGPGFQAYADSGQHELVVVVQIEHVDAIENLESILTVEGVDASIIGPYDLSASIGRPGELDHPEVEELLVRYESVSRSLEKPMGYHVIQPDADALFARTEAGYSFVAFSTDFLFLGESCRWEMGRVRDRSEGPAGDSP